MTVTARRLIELADGRSLDVTTGGPDVAAAVLLIQGTASGWIAFGPAVSRCSDILDELVASAPART
jgi:hypothetical protein